MSLFLFKKNIACTLTVFISVNASWLRMQYSGIQAKDDLDTILKTAFTLRRKGVFFFHRRKLHFKMNQTSPLIRLTSVIEFISAFNIFLSITTSLGNALILVALHKETSLHPPTKLLFRCLAVTDLCVGVVLQPLFAVLLLSSVTTGMNYKVIHHINKISKASSYVVCGVSTLTSCAISVDRLLALLLGLRYRQVVTLPRVRAVILCFWLTAFSCVSMFFWNGTAPLIVTLALITFSVAASVFSYTKIYFKLRQHQLQVHAVPPGQNGGGPVLLNIARYKMSVSSVLWVQLALVTCYIPFLALRVMLVTNGQISSVESKFLMPFFVTLTLMYLNSSLNPFLYCWRIRALRQAAKDTMKQFICCNSA